MVKEFVDATIRDNKIAVFAKTWCPHSKKAKAALDAVGAKDYMVVELDLRDDGDAIMDYLLSMTGARTVPRVFINGKFIGGGSETEALKNSGELKKLIES